MESWFWQARRTLAQNDSEINLSDREAFNRIASGYATRAESLSLFGSYPLDEAQQLVDGLFGVPYDRAGIEAKYAQRPLCLNDNVQLMDGMYFYQGAVRNTRRVVNKQNNTYLDLHPAEEILLALFDGQHHLTDVDAIAKELQSLPETASLPVRNGIDLVVQLDNIGALD